LWKTPEVPQKKFTAPLRISLAARASNKKEKPMNRPVVVLFASFAAVGTLWGQATFEVASIKPHPGIITFSSDPQVKGNRVTATASTLLDMMTVAYRVRYDQIAGAPGWAGSDHFDLDARAEGDGARSTEEIRPMLQALLADRFHLVVHRETKEVPIYALVVNKNGPRLQESSPGEERKGSISADGKGSHMEVAQGTMAQLALRLSGNGAGRPVIDKTGLTGKYSYKMNWMNGTPGPDSEWPSLFVALQEQLGLKLEPGKGPSEIISIDRAGKPSAN
jgi:uncharacterized protein (TIGR03435 family)